MVLLEEVVSAAKEMGSMNERQKEIKLEMKQVRDTFKQRLDPLDKRMKELETVIVDYLISNKMKAVKLGLTVFMLEKIPEFTSREQKIEEVLKNQPLGTQPEQTSKKIIQMLKKRIPKNVLMDTNKHQQVKEEEEDLWKKEKVRLKIYEQ